MNKNCDGFVDNEDQRGKIQLMSTWSSKKNNDSRPFNFTTFLTMFWEMLNDTDPRAMIINAFTCFREKGAGFVKKDSLRELLTTMGDQFTNEEVGELFREAPTDKENNSNHMEFTCILKHAAKK